MASSPTAAAPPTSQRLVSCWLLPRRRRKKTKSNCRTHAHTAAGTWSSSRASSRQANRAMRWRRKGSTAHDQIGPTRSCHHRSARRQRAQQSTMPAIRPNRASAPANKPTNGSTRRPSASKRRRQTVIADRARPFGGTIPIANATGKPRGPRVPSLETSGRRPKMHADSSGGPASGTLHKEPFIKLSLLLHDPSRPEARC